jgi:hypothetical protein
MLGTVDITIHLAQVTATRVAGVELRYEVRGHRGQWRNAA